jgi:hypothetical protein
VTISFSGTLYFPSISTIKMSDEIRLLGEVGFDLLDIFGEDAPILGFPYSCPDFLGLIDSFLIITVL